MLTSMLFLHKMRQFEGSGASVAVEGPTIYFFCQSPSASSLDYCAQCHILLEINTSQSYQLLTDVHSQAQEQVQDTDRGTADTKSSFTSILKAILRPYLEVQVKSASVKQREGVLQLDCVTHE